MTITRVLIDTGYTDGQIAQTHINVNQWHGETIVVSPVNINNSMAEACTPTVVASISAILHLPVFYLAVAVSQYVTVMQCTVHGVPKQLTIKCIYIAEKTKRKMQTQTMQ